MLRQYAYHDDLTGLFNRRYLQESVVSPAAIFLFDLDYFKNINDTVHISYNSYWICRKKTIDELKRQMIESELRYSGKIIETRWGNRNEKIMDYNGRIYYGRNAYIFSVWQKSR